MHEANFLTKILQVGSKVTIETFNDYWLTVLIAFPDNKIDKISEVRYLCFIVYKIRA